MFSKFTLFISLNLLSIVSLFPFCGFYVAKADSSLYNKASRVVFVRNEDKSVISMMNDYKGELKDFALVVPVPVVLQKEQIHVGDPKVFDHIDAYSAPRLVEYYDSNPCRVHDPRKLYKKASGVKSGAPIREEKEKVQDLGVKIEATYTVGEYDIVILSAEYSNGLEKWLTMNGYNIPSGAHTALEPYIKQKMKFFVAKVNLKEQQNSGLTYLRPLQFAFNSEKFMLPIRLGMINSEGEQDLLLYILTKKGRVETTNYRTIQLPTNIELPEFIKSEFAKFYLAMFDKTIEKENKKVLVTEYVWNMGWCDPCAAEPLSSQELSSLGVFWLDDQFATKTNEVMITRLHVKYSKNQFPEDLVFQETKDTSQFQGRYILRHAWKGSPSECRAAEDYFQKFQKQEEQRAENLAKLTGWNIGEIRSKMNLNQTQNSNNSSSEWWKKIWK